MNDKCFEIGTIQAFLDGETSPQLSFDITSHTAKCDNCALLLANAEEETAQVFAMLDRELNTLVPTQRLWSSITVALAEEKKHVSLWDRSRGYLLALFANPSLAVACSVLVVFGLVAGIWTLKTPVSNDLAREVAVAPAPVSPAGTAVEHVNTTGTTEPISAAPKRIEVGVTDLPPAKIREMIQTANYRSESRAATAQHAVVKTGPASAPEFEEGMPGEESYVRTIATLKETVDSRKDLIMDPSARVSFERDLAVVNDSIKKMKDVVQKNPKNQAAKQVLYSSYQNKIDLLNSVVEREELLASLQ